MSILVHVFNSLCWNWLIESFYFTRNLILATKLVYCRFIHFIFFEKGPKLRGKSLIFYWCFDLHVFFSKTYNYHSMARANLNKSKKVLTNTTAASKYIPRRPRISINWNPPFQNSLHKISKEVFFRLTTFFFRNKIFFKKQLLFSFLCIVKQKKNSERSENFWNFSFF